MKWLTNKAFLAPSVKQLLRLQANSWTSETISRNPQASSKSYFVKIQELFLSPSLFQFLYTRGRQPMAHEPDVALLMAASGSQPKF